MPHAPVPQHVRDHKDLDVGNTQVVGEMVADLVEGDVFRDRELPDLSQYDSITLGSPVWTR